MFKKIVAVGDNSKDKTVLLTFAAGKYSNDTYTPRVFDNTAITTKYGDVQLWDTAGQEDLDVLRPATYTWTNLFIVMYDTTNIASYKNIKEKWAPELARQRPNVPYALIGVLKKDKPIINTVQGQQMAKDIGAKIFYEVSLKDHKKLQEILDKIYALAHTKH